MEGIFFFWLGRLSVAECRLSLLERAGFSLCSGFSCCGAPALGVRASVVVAHRFGCSAVHELFPDQVFNLCPLHWQADSGPPGKS